MEKTKADLIFKNGKVFTSDPKNPIAEAFAVKDGRFLYVGDEKGLAGLEGEVRDLGGRFVMPGLIDSHQHITMCVVNDYGPAPTVITCKSKKECLEIIRKTIEADRETKEFRFMLKKEYLNGEQMTYRDLDAVSGDARVVIIEGIGHSGWVNSNVMKDMNITEEVEDVAPGLSYYERDKDGKLTGFQVEFAFQPSNYRYSKELTDAQIRESLERYVAFSRKIGITAVFEAGTPECMYVHERTLRILCDMDKEGKLPFTIESSYMIQDPRQIDGCIEKLRDLDRKFHTEHVHCRIMKMMLDGIINAHSAALITPYSDGSRGGRLVDEKTLCGLLLRLDEAGYDFHVHTMGELAVKTVLDAVELAQESLGRKLRINVTCAHLDVIREEEIRRFASLGVIADYTPGWHAGSYVSGRLKGAMEMLGEERGRNFFRCATMWREGALVTFSSDTIAFGDFSDFNPFINMQIGMLRKDIGEAIAKGSFSLAEEFPPESEKMTIEQMLLGYTANGAKQLRLGDRKGSIEAGKDADFLVLNKDLLTCSPEEIYKTEPEEAYSGGILMNV